MTNRIELPAMTWRRVSPKLITINVLSMIVAGIVLTAITVPFLLQRLWWAPWVTAVIVVVTVIGVIVTPRRVRAFGYQLRQDDLVFRRGILFQRFVAVPYGRMQLVDINRGPLSRVVGLSELKLVTAAAASGVTIPGLPASDAEELRDQLVKLAESRRAGL